MRVIICILNIRVMIYLVHKVSKEGGRLDSRARSWLITQLNDLSTALALARRLAHSRCLLLPVEYKEVS